MKEIKRWFEDLKVGEIEQWVEDRKVDGARAVGRG